MGIGAVPHAGDGDSPAGSGIISGTPQLLRPAPAPSSPGPCPVGAPGEDARARAPHEVPAPSQWVPGAGPLEAGTRGAGRGVSQRPSAITSNNVITKLLLRKQFVLGLSSAKSSPALPHLPVPSWEQQAKLHADRDVPLPLKRYLLSASAAHKLFMACDSAAKCKGDTKEPVRAWWHGEPRQQQDFEPRLVLPPGTVWGQLRSPVPCPQTHRSPAGAPAPRPHCGSRRTPHAAVTRPPFLKY